MDTSHLLSYLSSYAFPTASHTISTNIVLGISLGGHAAWHCVLHDARISTAVIVIGCPDYTRLMMDRARKSKLQTWVSTERPGAQFLGSVDFPKGLIEAIEKHDPAGLLMGELDVVTGDDHLHEPSDEEKTRLRPLMRDHLGGKRILCLSGGADKLVPYQCGEPFLGFLKRAVGEGGWFSDRETVLEDIVDIKAGHEFSPKMKDEAISLPATLVLHPQDVSTVDIDIGIDIEIFSSIPNRRGSKDRVKPRFMGL
ncbi:hypothetical protein B0A49_09057 [Cryomyces minteri]|uniref:AB hydrolase-1 domain-containing protein n=1 Tax=Cryomyces minteri TaxID=331657 RepID=A0A4U0WNB1_9PEZI|nr:hypothetical protein B0A49_09057 [Cryomyces minteri]